MEASRVSALTRLSYVALFLIRQPRAHAPKPQPEGAAKKKGKSAMAGWVDDGDEDPDAGWITPRKAPTTVTLEQLVKQPTSTAAVKLVTCMPIFDRTTNRSFNDPKNTSVPLSRHKLIS
jgi:hypothetical protein